jgi:hypothetical protein
MLVVTNSAMPGFLATGSGTGPAGVGCIAGDMTVNSAVKGVPLIKIAFWFLVFIVLFMGVSVTETVPVPGVTKGGAVYGRGAKSEGGSSSPSKQTSMLFTFMFALVPTSGIGAASGGTTAGGVIVIRIMSPVLIIKSAGICGLPSPRSQIKYGTYYIKIMLRAQPHDAGKDRIDAKFDYVTRSRAY